MTPERVEQAMDGNLCRCTGYRPILDAFKTFAPETDAKTKLVIKDIDVPDDRGTRGMDRLGRASKFVVKSRRNAQAALIAWNWKVQCSNVSPDRISTWRMRSGLRLITVSSAVGLN